MRKVVILNGNHLCHNPRVLKEAAALAAAGHDVEILGASFDRGLAARDLDLAAGQAFRYTPVFELFADGARRSFGAQALRARMWAAKRAARLGVDTPSALGYGIHRILREAERREADLYIAHSEPTLWVAAKLSRSGATIGVDMEDWFSEDYITAERPRRLIRQLEAQVLACAAHATCTSHAMSAALASEYRCDPPAVIYNAFPRSELDGRTRDRRDTSIASLHWFSQTVGPGRGLEDLFAALPALKTPVEVHIRGNARGSNRTWFDGAVPAEWRDRVFLHAVVSNAELPSRIAEHDIGLALERDRPRNKDLTVSNKILQYLQAGLAVVATATAGQREVDARVPGAVALYAPGEPMELAERLNALLMHRGALEHARSAAQSASSVFAWERIAPALVASVDRACAAQSSRTFGASTVA